MTIEEALNVIRSCTKSSMQRFSVSFLTYDAKRGGAGKLKTLERCHIAGSSHDVMEHDTINVKSEASGSHVVTIHLRLILQLNGERVYV